jgi:hypothetical protein
VRRTGVGINVIVKVNKFYNVILFRQDQAPGEQRLPGAAG